MFDRAKFPFSTPLSRREALAVSLGSATAGAAVIPDSGRTAEPMTLIRSKDGRRLSRFRYRNAEAFFMGIEHGRYGRAHDLLYQAGIVAQLALSSHLLDLGFEDQWCARNLGLNIGAALACANASGLGHSSSEFEELAAILSPYSRWRDPGFAGARPSLPSRLPGAAVILRALLDDVRDVTGHSRPAKGRNGG